MTRILFIGSYLSSSTGTKNVIETIKEDLKEDDIIVRLVSKRKNRIIRLFEILIVLLFAGETHIVFEVFSGRAFQITRIGSLLTFLRRKKVTFILQGGALPDFTKNHQRIVKNTFARASTLLTPSNYLKEYFSKEGFDVKYFPNPINLKKFPYKRGDYKPYSILWVRAFTKIYNPDIPVKVIAEIIRQYPRASLTMVGPDKGMLNEIREQINYFGLNNAVTIVGPVDNQELYKFYHKSEVYLNTTSFESFGLSVVEAAASGIPIISSNVGEIPFIWEDRKNILLVDSLNPISFAEKVIELFDNKDLANSLSTSAREKAETFDWAKIRPHWIKQLNVS